MTKIRVYELAKEAEMENKDLVAALIEMGYAIKSHSSTLEDEIAQEI
ncbi:MAG: translation initiation factor IF-2 N-terminal domain-containing protein, partial [Pseudomonadota bacterium]